MEIPQEVLDRVRGLPDTRPLYYEDAYKKSFDAKILEVAEVGDKLYVVLDETCFFPEGGGQAGDIGRLSSSSGELDVIDTQSADGVIVHICKLISGSVVKGKKVHGEIDWDVRYARMRQHTASHILFSALRHVLGVERLVYMGVGIGDEFSRIDINYGKPITPEQLEKAESISNRICLENRKVKTWFTTREEAERLYGSKLGVTEVTPTGVVRVVEVDDWDVALCCGTHVSSTSEVGLIKIIERYRLQKGVERVEFTAGVPAYRRFEDAVRSMSSISRLLQVPVSEVEGRVKKLLEERRTLKERLEKILGELAELKAERMLLDAESIGEFRLVIREFRDLSPKEIRRMATYITSREPRAVVVLGSVYEGKPYLVCAAGERAVKVGINTAALAGGAAEIIKGRGGGAPKIAQAGGIDAKKLGEALNYCKGEVLRILRA